MVAVKAIPVRSIGVTPSASTNISAGGAKSSSGITAARTTCG